MRLDRSLVRRSPSACAWTTAVFLAVLPCAGVHAQPRQAGGQSQPAAVAPGTPFNPQRLASLLPPSVYFQGRTAPIQLRNAAAVSFRGGAIVWAALVDTSGYATGVQDKYQFYLVTEEPLLIGGARLAPGAYGGGFVGDRFEIMDIGGHQVADGPTHLDSAMPRPRPLQMLPESPDNVKLVLGRRSVELKVAPFVSHML